MTKRIDQYEADLSIVLDELDVVETELGILDSEWNLSEEAASEMSKYEYYLRTKATRRQILLLQNTLQKSIATLEELYKASQEQYEEQ